ncbi:hypothetical protein ILUMI_07698 [Ignelater luminosus]|uniref:Beta-glucosidase n=1 Tax=Ignelater luminosus TaxID=2038154 RepID=A0A8K0D313_IGNLU|nr:hypothetical protein ILUMI_07698 [Ignelater luminosus]
METITCLFLLIVVSLGFEINNNVSQKRFPDGFIFGTASSSYQTEGAWNLDGKGENIWDRFTHDHPEKIADGSNGDIAADSYHKLDEDIRLLKNLGVDFYRFSLSWARILPNGFPNKINQAGIDYYNELIDKLLENNIMPMITMYHWELPQKLHLLGGFTNPLIADWFEAYAKIVFQHFGDRVKFWSTFNEPRIMCSFGYGLGTFAPGIESSGVGDYLCAHNLLKAHARVYHMYKKQFKYQKGKIGIVIDCHWSEPATQSDSDIKAAERMTQFSCGWITNPIFTKKGDYPKVMKDFVKARSLAEGYNTSRLPEFTKDEIKYIRKSSDYLGLNHYMTFMVADKPADPIGDPSQEKDIQVATWQDPSWPPGTVYPFRSTPWGFRKVLKWLKDNCGDVDIYVTENGFPDAFSFEDKGRISYLLGYLSNLLESIYIDKVKVKAYTAWSFMDYFEWYSGYTVGFGLHYVNYTDPNRTRIPRASARIYTDIIKNRKLPSSLTYL